MNARIALGWLLGIAGAVGASFQVVAQDAPPPPPTISADSALTAAQVTNTSAPAGALAPMPLAPASAAGRLSSAETPLSTGASEIQSLVKAGVDQPVILAYLTNFPRSLNLSPDHIIQLQGAGVPPQIISAMIQHDRALPATAPAESDSAAPAAGPALPPPTPDQVQILDDDGPWAGDYLVVDEGYSVAEQPASAGPVRAPYPVKLNDPIVILKLPTFTVPCW